jgi:hypothetical protein
MELFRKLLLLLYFRGLMYQKSSSVTIDVLTHRSIYVYWICILASINLSKTAVFQSSQLSKTIINTGIIWIIFFKALD